MKVKNIMFSGFAAAVFATVCGAAVAADVSLISKDYADAKLQAKLTEGQGIDIAEQADGTTTISTNVNLSTLATKESVEALEQKIGVDAEGNVVSVSDALEQKIGTLKNDNGENITVQAALAGKQDTLTPEQQAAINSGIDSDAVAQITTNKENISDLTTRMTDAESDIQTNTEAINTLSGGNGSQGIATLIQDVKDNTADIAKLNGTATEEGSVAKSIADALANGNYIDATELEGKGYQTATDVDTAISELKLDETYATVSALDGVKATAEAAQTAEEVSSAIDTKISGLKLGETYATVSALEGVKETADAAQTAEEVGTAIDTKISGLKLDENYQAKLTETQIAAVNSGVDSDKVAAIAKNTQGIADNAAEIAKKVSVVTTAGTYLVNFDATGAVSYAPIKILDKDGNEITLNGDNAITPAAN